MSLNGFNTYLILYVEFFVDCEYYDGVSMLVCLQAMAGKEAPSLLDLQKDAIKTGTRNAGGGKQSLK